MCAMPPRSSGVRESMFSYRLWWNVTNPLPRSLSLEPMSPPRPELRRML